MVLTISRAKNILGVASDNFDETSLKKLYHRKARKFHPDHHPNDKDASKNFNSLTEAYKFLLEEIQGSAITGEVDSSTLKDIGESVKFEMDGFLERQNKTQSASDSSSTFSKPKTLDDILYDNFEEGFSVIEVYKTSSLFETSIRYIDSSFPGDSQKRDKLDLLSELIDCENLGHLEASCLATECFFNNPIGFNFSNHRNVQQFKQAYQVLNKIVFNHDDFDMFKDFYLLLHESIVGLNQEKKLHFIESFVGNDSLTNTLALMEIAKKIHLKYSVTEINKIYSRINPKFLTILKNVFNNLKDAENNNYSEDEAIDVLDAGTYLSMDGYIGFKLSLANIPPFYETIAQHIPSDTLPDFFKFVNLYRKSTRAYDTKKKPLNTWKELIENDFSLYLKSIPLYTGCLNALRELKYDEDNKNQWWPGIIYVTVDSAMTFTRELIEQYGGDISKVHDITQDFSNFRRSQYFSKKPSKILELTPTQHNIYKLLSEIKYKQDRGSKKLTSDDARKILQFYYG